MAYDRQGNWYHDKTKWRWAIRKDSPTNVWNGIEIIGKWNLLWYAIQQLFARN